MAWRSIVSTAAVLGFLSACGGDEDDVEQSQSPSTADEPDQGDGTATAGDGDGDDGQGDGIGDGDGDGADDGESDGTDGARSRYLASCEAACTTHAECVGLPAEQCIDQCGARATELEQSACLDEGAAENECLGELTCEQLVAYAQHGRRVHEQCGGEARAFFDRCTVGSGKVPPACSELCQRFDACGSMSEYVAACEESCVLRATSLRAAHGATCSDGYLDLMGCVASANCDRVEIFATQGTVPEACASIEQTLPSACGG